MPNRLKFSTYGSYFPVYEVATDTHFPKMNGNNMILLLTHKVFHTEAICYDFGFGYGEDGLRIQS